MATWYVSAGLHVRFIRVVPHCMQAWSKHVFLVKAQKPPKLPVTGSLTNMRILTTQPQHKPVLSNYTHTYTDNNAIGRGLTHNQILPQVIHSLPCIIHQSIPQPLHSAVNSLGDWLTCCNNNNNNNNNKNNNNNNNNNNHHHHNKNKIVYLASRHQVHAAQVSLLQTGLFTASWV